MDTIIVFILGLSAIGGAASIDKIELYFGDMSDTLYSLFNQRIYMGHTSLSTWTNNLPDVGHSEAGSTVTNRTYCKTNFTVSLVKANDLDTWLEFTFDNSFSWNGTDNIVIDWENRDGSFNFGGPRFDTLPTKAGSVAYEREDDNFPSGECDLDDLRPIMKITYS